MKVLISLLYLLALNVFAGIGGYPDQVEIDKKLIKLSHDYPNITSLELLGNSVEGRPIYILKLHNKKSKQVLIPTVALMAGIHGDEIVGREIVLRLAQDLLIDYKKNLYLQNLLSHFEILIVPCLNPDGCQNVTRTNAQGFDLNREFPDRTIDGVLNSKENRPKEVQLWMEYQEKNPIAMSLAFHGGEIPAVDYPWDNSPEAFSLQPLCLELAREYAGLNPEMRNNPNFPGGAVQGNSWYAIFGGMGDWSLYFYNNIQLTIEVSEFERPLYEKIPEFYRHNKASILSFIRRIQNGIGFYFYPAGTSGEVLYTRHSDHKVFGPYSFRHSSSYQILEKGEYEVSVKLNNGKTTQFTQTINDSGNNSPVSLLSF